MKTLLVTGTAKTRFENGQHIISYECILWGQHPSDPLLRFIKPIKFETVIGYDALMTEAHKLYVKYYNDNGLDIIHLDHIIRL